MIKLHHTHSQCLFTGELLNNGIGAEHFREAAFKNVMYTHVGQYIGKCPLYRGVFIQSVLYQRFHCIPSVTDQSFVRPIPVFCVGDRLVLKNTHIVRSLALLYTTTEGLRTNPQLDHYFQPGNHLILCFRIRGIFRKSHVSH